MLKVPHEELTSRARECQTVSEKDVLAASQLVQQLSKRVFEQDDVNWVKVNQNLERVEKRLAKIKKKLQDANSKSEVSFGRLKKRVRFISQADETSLVDLYMADHLIRRGHIEAGSQVAEKRGFTDLVDVDVFQSTTLIAEKLKAPFHDIDLAVKWCSRNNEQLLRIDSSLEFRLRRARFAQLVQDGKPLEAVQYAKDHLAPFAHKHLGDIQEAMSSLLYDRVLPRNQSLDLVAKEDEIFDRTDTSLSTKSGIRRSRRNSKPETTLSRKMQLKTKRSASCSVNHKRTREGCAVSDTLTRRHTPCFGETDWEELAQFFIEESERVLNLEHQTTLQVTVKAGLASLKCASCGPNSSVGIGSEAYEAKVRECPCCSPHLGTLATQLPTAHHVHSALICRITGKLMDEHNPPLMFPDGAVFSTEGLRSISKDGKFPNPREPDSGKLYGMDDLHKIFIA